MKPVRIGIAGLGNFGEVHVRTISGMPEFELAAVCSRSAERAEAIAEEYAVPCWYEDIEGLAADPEIEAVDVVTEVARHANTIKSALSAGKHVLVEKPLSARIDETESVLRLAEDRHRFVMVGYIERYDPRRSMIQQQVASGELGEVVSLYARRNCGREYLSWPRFQRWPVIIEPGIHSVDMLTWLAGSTVTRVHSIGRSHNEYDIVDTWWATLEFENGAVGVIEQVWQMPKGAAAEWDQDNFLEVIGTKGTSQMRDPTDAFWTWTSDRTLSHDFYLLPEVAGQVVGALRNELACFARCIRTGEHTGIATPKEIRHTTEVALAIVESATRRRPIDLA